MPPAYQLRHHIALALAEAGKPLTISEITAHATEIARRTGVEGNYTPWRIAHVLQTDSQLRWVDQSIRGLSSWEVGHSTGADTDTNRIKAADEIAHVLQTAHQPATSKRLDDHILSRFNVAVHAALYRPYGRQRFIINPDRTVSLGPKEAPTSDGRGPQRFDLHQPASSSGHADYYLHQNPSLGTSSWTL